MRELRIIPLHLEKIQEARVAKRRRSFKREHFKNSTNQQSLTSLKRSLTTQRAFIKEKWTFIHEAAWELLTLITLTRESWRREVSIGKASTMENSGIKKWKNCLMLGALQPNGYLNNKTIASKLMWWRFREIVCRSQTTTSLTVPLIFLVKQIDNSPKWGWRCWKGGNKCLTQTWRTFPSRNRKTQRLRVALSLTCQVTD